MTAIYGEDCDIVIDVLNNINSLKKGKSISKQEADSDKTQAEYDNRTAEEKYSDLVNTYNSGNATCTADPDFDAPKIELTTLETAEIIESFVIMLDMVSRDSLVATGLYILLDIFTERLTDSLRK